MDLLVAAVDHLVHRLGHGDLHVAIVGFGSGLEEMRADVARRGLGDRFTFHGALYGPAMLAVLNSADIGVAPDPKNPMNDISTMNKVMEYMALRKPVVQFDLTEGRASAEAASLYARANDPEDFARQIARLIEDPALRERMGRTGEARVREALGWEHSAPRLLAAYERIFGRIEGSRPGRLGRRGRGCGTRPPAQAGGPGPGGRSLQATAAPASAPPACVSQATCSMKSHMARFDGRQAQGEAQGPQAAARRGRLAHDERPRQAEDDPGRPDHRARGSASQEPEDRPPPQRQAMPDQEGAANPQPVDRASSQRTRSGRCRGDGRARRAGRRRSGTSRPAGSRSWAASRAGGPPRTPRPDRPSGARRPSPRGRGRPPEQSSGRAKATEDRSTGSHRQGGGGARTGEGSGCAMASYREPGSGPASGAGPGREGAPEGARRPGGGSRPARAAGPSGRRAASRPPSASRSRK